MINVEISEIFYSMARCHWKFQHLKQKNIYNQPKHYEENFNLLSVNS
jgi:hypothetical protein